MCATWYDALSTRRPYQEACPGKKGVGAAAEQAGDRDGPPMVRAFLSLLSEKASETRTPLVGTGGRRGLDQATWSGPQRS